MLKKSRVVLGLGIDFLGTPYHKALFAGIERACIALDVDLVCFVTGRLDARHEVEYCRNALVQYLARAQVDGVLVAAGSMGNLVDANRLESLLATWGSLPLAVFGNRFRNERCVQVPGGADLGPIVTHLVEKHGCHRLAYLGGSAYNSEAVRRQQSVETACRRLGVAIDPGLCFEGDFRTESGRRVVETLLAGGSLPDALICANDAMAWGALECLRGHGLVPGWDIAVTGYDDIESGAFLGLTSMRQEIEEEAARACASLVRVIMGEPWEPLVHIPETLVIRETCGCRGTTSAGSVPEVAAAAADWPILRELEEGHRRLGAWCIDQPGRLSDESHRIVEACQTGRVREVQSALAARGAFLRAGLLDRSRSLAVASRDLRMDSVNDLSERIASCFESDKLHAVLRNELGTVGIGACLLARYVDPGITAAGIRIEQADGFCVDGLAGTVAEGLPLRWLLGGQRRSLIVHALFHGYEQIGLAVFGHGARDLDFYEQLRLRISLALKGCSLIDALRGHAAGLERTVAERTAELRAELETRRRTEAELRRREEQIRELATMVPGVVMELDGRLNIRFVNQAGAEALACRPPVEGQPPIPFLPLLEAGTRDEVRDFLRVLLHAPGSGPCQRELRVAQSGRPPLVMLVNVRATGTVSQGRGLYLSALDLNPILDSAVSPGDLFHEHFHLSPRVREVFDLMLRGLNIRAIALELGIAKNTVKVHIHQVYVATGARNREELFALLKEYQARDFGYGSFLHSLLAGVLEARERTPTHQATSAAAKKGRKPIVDMPARTP